MKHAVTLLLALVACHAVGSLRLLERRCSSKSRSQRRLIGGLDSELFSTPWMAYLHRNGKFVCAGSLITYRFVLTAAHCIPYREELAVRLGEYDARTHTDCREQGCALPAQDFAIESFHPHPSYTTITHYDIALLKLKTQVVEQKNMTPICIVLDTTDTWQRYVDSIEQFSVAGWGKTETGALSHVLKAANVTQVERYSCLADYGYDATENHICAGDVVRRACEGDSGGPLVATVTNARVDFKVQLGIVSYGEGTCNGLSVFTNVRSYIPWIVDTIKNHNEQETD
ncbi:serine protease grass-like [Drosophila madeirensis]|uniref:Serine protease grass-like n=1 Tax=Drosophila madeirensis TaxID=30013 RepID=A0AAU9GDK0_DROMD